MHLRIWGLLLLLVLTSSSAGCFLKCGWPMTLARWNQDGIYEAMPPPGKFHGFDIEHVDDHGGPPGLNHVARRSTSTEQWTVGAEPDDNISMSFAKRERLDDAATGRALNSTFERLGLPPPRLESWRFEWMETIC